MQRFVYYFSLSLLPSFVCVALSPSYLFLTSYFFVFFFKNML